MHFDLHQRLSKEQRFAQEYSEVLFARFQEGTMRGKAPLLQENISIKPEPHSWTDSSQRTIRVSISFSRMPFLIITTAQALLEASFLVTEARKNGLRRHHFGGSACWCDTIFELRGKKVVRSLAWRKSERELRESGVLVLLCQAYS